MMNPVILENGLTLSSPLPKLSVPGMMTERGKIITRVQMLSAHIYGFGFRTNIILKLRSLKRAMNLENSMNPGKDIA
jgi:hypothetical protein